MSGISSGVLLGDRRLLPNIIDQRAELDPHALYAQYPVSASTYTQGFRHITIADFANAINGAAWWIHDTVGPGSSRHGRTKKTLAYMGPNDVRYLALVVGAVKAGHMIFLTSPRNSIAAQKSLLEALQCTILLSPNPRPPYTVALADACELNVLEVPSVEVLLNGKHAPFPFEAHYEEALSEPFVAVHTSGSTGIPKPLIYTHNFAVTNMKLMAQDAPPGFENQHLMYRGKRLFMTFPPFHAAFLAWHLFFAIPHGCSIAAPASGTIPSAEGLVEALKQAPVDVAIIVPSIIQELGQAPELLDYCAANLERVIYCGGDLPQSIGDIVAAKMTLMNQYGASELGLQTHLYSKENRSREDWKYVQFHPDSGVELRHVTGDVYEFTVVRNEKFIMQQPTFALFPDMQEYGSRDLFIRHPTLPDLWKWTARLDDVIVFLNGEKHNPISTEQHISSGSPKIHTALVTGAQRFQAALIIEPAIEEGKKLLSPKEKAAFIEDVWPLIEEANQDCPAHARISQTHILLTNPESPMVRSGKGTIQRAATLQLYKKKLDALYADADTIAARIDDGFSTPVKDLSDFQAVSEFIRSVIMTVTNWTSLGETDDLFALGMDSLQVLLAVRKLRRGLALPVLATTTIYTNPSVKALANIAAQLKKNHHDSQALDDQTRLQTRSTIFKEYREVLDQIVVPTPTATQNSQTVGQHVILTGSTGSLGSYILHALLANHTVAQVYCLNRAVDGKSRQQERNGISGLPNHLDSNRVSFYTAEFSQPQLGLESAMYNHLLSNTTLIIHNAWPVNFNLSLPSFRPQLSGLANLISLTAATASRRIFFVSSISSVLSYTTTGGETPEEVILDLSAAGPNGYAESKHVSERLLKYAVHKLGIRASFARVGQIAGAARFQGCWNKAEWFPSLVLSSLHLGAVPDSLGGQMGRVDWVPIDTLAEVLVELALSNDTVYSEPQVFHPLNPHPTSWDTIRPIILDELSTLLGVALETIPLAAWLQRIRKSVEAAGNTANKEDLDRLLQLNPAVKLLDFYEDVLALQEHGNVLLTHEAEKMSASLAALRGVEDEWVRKWVREWVR